MNLEHLTRVILERAAALAACSETHGHITRRALTPAMREAHGLLRVWLEPLGFRCHTDAAGNLRARSPWGHGPALLAGSHLDSIVDAGPHDGVLGVLLMLAVAEALPDGLAFPLEIVGFADEEGVRFRRPYFGSRALVGALREDDLQLRDGDGITLEQALRDAGLNPVELGAAALQPGEHFAFVEPHIEQGPVLEERGAPLGVVSAICAQRWLELELRGQASHAGTTPMHLRRDALAGAAELVLAAERLAQETPGLRATVGRVELSPNVGNAVPGRARFSLDLRHQEDRGLAAAALALEAQAREVATRRGLGFAMEQLVNEPATACDDSLRRIMRGSLVACGLPEVELASGAGHDARFLATRLPSVMLFVRSPGGLSHHPEESVLPADLESALQTLLTFLRRIEERAPRSIHEAETD